MTRPSQLLRTKSGLPVKKLIASIHVTELPMNGLVINAEMALKISFKMKGKSVGEIFGYSKGKLKNFARSAKFLIHKI